MDVLSLKNRLRERLRGEGLSEEQIEARLTKLDVEFLLHCFVNGMESLPFPEKRMELYLNYLERELDSIEEPVN